MVPFFLGFLDGPGRESTPELEEAEEAEAADDAGEGGGGGGGGGDGVCTGGSLSMRCRFCAGCAGEDDDDAVSSEWRIR